ncbi:MAG: M48 family metalloprotease [Acidobacteria bacterium]|nr:M48 family metalloprotease [Acidobacteriota bacterium]
MNTPIHVRRPGSAVGHRSSHWRNAVLVWLLILAAGPLLARVEIKPGFNTFTPEQDIELGQEASKEIEKEYPLVNDAQLNDYISRLGQKLARYAPGQRFPYNFSVVHNKDLNAFALPGGPIYIHSAIITAAENESQLAGVLAHEISHVALRHSTNQASKAMLARAPLAILGGVLGSGSLGGTLAQLGIAFGVNSAFLKFSRDAERQADQQGAQILYDAGYDPRQMAQFFETLEKEYGRGGAEFFASHPNPGNRLRDISQLIPQLGPPRNYSVDSSEFEQMRRRAQTLRDAPPGNRPGGAASRTQPSRPSPPSAGMRSLDADWVRLGYPDNWEVYGEGTSSITLVPPEGIVQAGPNVMPAVAYGALISTYESYQETGRRMTLENATDQLIRELQRSNPNLRVTSRARTFRHSSGQNMLSVMAAGDSPLAGETEVNWIVTSFRPEGLWYAVFIAPQSTFQSWQPSFQRMLDSVRFPR